MKAKIISSKLFGSYVFPVEIYNIYGNGTNQNYGAVEIGGGTVVFCRVSVDLYLTLPAHRSLFGKYVEKFFFSSP